MTKEIEKEKEIRGAELALKEAISRLRGSVHPQGCEDGIRGDKQDGIKLSGRICAHVDKIEDALKYWEKALRHYNFVTPDNANNDDHDF